MDAVEFLKETERMCKSNEECIKCDGRNCCVKRRGPLCDFGKFVEIVENWSKTHPVIELTEQQKTAIRGRIAEGDKWAITWKGVAKVCFSEEKPFLNDSKIVFREFYRTGDRCFYNFLKDGVPVYLPDLLGGEE